MFYKVVAEHKGINDLTCKVITKHYLFGFILIFVFESIEDE